MADWRHSENSRAPWRDRWNEVIFGHHTAPGRLYDIILIVLILLSVLCVLLESVRSLREAYGFYLRAAEWAFTFLFTIEYAFRLIAAKSAKHYAISFYGIN